MANSNIETDLEAEVYAEIQTTHNDVGINRAFNEIDLTELQSNTYEFPVPANDTDPVTPMQEGEPVPRAGTEFERETVRFDKFGFEVTDDADEDEITERVEHLYATIASYAVEQIYDEVSCTWVHNENRLDVIKEAMFESGKSITYGDQDTIIVPAVLGEAIANDDPTREWDEIAADLSDEHEMEVVTDEFNVLRGGDVLVVNSDRFGYQCIRTYPETRHYTEYEEHDPARGVNVPEDEREVKQEVVQAYLRTGYAVIKPDEAHIVRFGRI